MDSFEFALLAMRNTLSDMWAGFARFMDWAAIGDPDKFYNTPQPDPTRLIYDPHYDWYSGNVHHSDTHISNHRNDDFDFMKSNELSGISFADDQSHWTVDPVYSFTPGNVFHHE